MMKIVMRNITIIMNRDDTEGYMRSNMMLMILMITTTIPDDNFYGDSFEFQLASIRGVAFGAVARRLESQVVASKVHMKQFNN